MIHDPLARADYSIYIIMCDVKDDESVTFPNSAFEGRIIVPVRRDLWTEIPN